MLWRVPLLVLFCLSTTIAVKQKDLLDSCPVPPYNNALAEILVNAIEAFRPLMPIGVPELGIPPLDPMGPLPSIAFNVTNEYIVLDGTVNDTVVYNLAQFIICEVTVELGLRPKFYIDLRMEDFHMNGTYDMDGVYVAIFPIFGSGLYVLDVFNSSMNGGAQINYNVLTDHAQIKDLVLNITFQELQLFMECILGCGQMSDIVNEFLSDIATAIFNAVWEVIGPILSSAIENGLNNILKDISISEVLSPGTTHAPFDEFGKIVDGKLSFRFPLSRLMKENLH